MLSTNVFKMDELNALCMDLLPQNTNHPNFWSFIITKYDQIVTKKTLTEEVRNSLKQISL